MRSYQYLILLLAFALCLHSAAAAPYLGRRQDDVSATPTATADESRQPSSTAAPTSSGSRPTFISANSTIISSTTSVSETSTSATTSTTSNSPSPSVSSSAAANSQNELPIQPKITPALGIAGIILLISGAVYGVIGIKNSWVYVFGSACYLSSLAVTVLIIYLMSPDISNAVQGGFFVAVFITGVIFGALALAFKDLTDGLGCLLGGFCVSMWFLTLKEGGLIESTAGRAIFIACMSVAAYALSWSHYTRTYGLMGCISFAGATITILGVDCFSRAGLKEFWLYLWNLNPDQFPLNTNTYPMTKGLKAELAGVILLTIFGLISQLKVWKMIRERREATEAQRQEGLRQQEMEEEKRGRNIEDKLQKERAQWEAIYNKGAHASIIESGLTTPMSVRSIREKDSLRCNSLEIQRHSKTGSTLSQVHVPENDDVEAVDADAKPLPPNPRQTQQATRHVTSMDSIRASSEVMGSTRWSKVLAERGSLRPSAPPPPPVVPLPFKIPVEDDARSQISDNASISAVPDVPEEHEAFHRSFSKGLSAGRPSVERYDSAGPLAVPHDEDDRASSVAATLDDEMSIRELSRPASLVDVEDSEDAFQDNIPVNTPLPAETDDELEGESTVVDTTQDNESLKDIERSVETANQVAASPPTSGYRMSLTVSTDPKPDGWKSRYSALKSPHMRTDTVISSLEDDGAKSQKSSQPTPSSSKGTSMSQTEQNDSATESFEGVLSSRLSKIAQAYRVNEWSKHLEAAEKPEVEDIQEPDSPGIQMDYERAVPVSEEIAQPLIMSKGNSSKTSVGGYQSGTVTARNSQADLRTPTRPSSALVSGASHASRQSVNRFSRSSSAQLPYSEPVSHTRRLSSAPSPSTNNTLMGKRESLLRNRTSTQSFMNHTTATPTADSPQATGEEMTLAQRRRALQHQKPPQASQKWQKNTRTSAVVPAPIQVPGFDSHQPKRSSSSLTDQKREELLAGWRESMRHSSGGAVTPVPTAAMVVPADEQERRAQLINAKRQKEHEEQQQALLVQKRESMMQSMMRSSEMLDAHREAMRRMQASANKNSA